MMCGWGSMRFSLRRKDTSVAQITGVNGNILYLGHLAMDTTCKSLKKNHPVDVNFIKITKAYNSSKIIEKKNRCLFTKR